MRLPAAPCRCSCPRRHLKTPAHWSPRSVAADDRRGDPDRQPELRPARRRTAPREVHAEKAGDQRRRRSTAVRTAQQAADGGWSVRPPARQVPWSRRARSRSSITSSIEFVEPLGQRARGAPERRPSGRRPSSRRPGETDREARSACRWTWTVVRRARPRRTRSSRSPSLRIVSSIESISLPELFHHHVDGGGDLLDDRRHQLDRRGVAMAGLDALADRLHRAQGAPSPGDQRPRSVDRRTAPARNPRWRGRNHGQGRRRRRQRSRLRGRAAGASSFDRSALEPRPPTSVHSASHFWARRSARLKCSQSHSLGPGGVNSSSTGIASAPEQRTPRRPGRGGPPPSRFAAGFGAEAEVRWRSSCLSDRSVLMRQDSRRRRRRQSRRSRRSSARCLARLGRSGQYAAGDSSMTPQIATAA